MVSSHSNFSILEISQLVIVLSLLDWSKRCAGRRTKSLYFFSWSKQTALMHDLSDERNRFAFKPLTLKLLDRLKIFEAREDLC